MKYFAQLNSNNIVKQIINVPDDYNLSSNNEYVEDLVIKKLESTYGYDTYWKECTGKVFIGDTYNESENKFLSSKPFDSWVLDDNGNAKPPIDYPDDGEIYDWNEETEQWDVIE
jgi:hypothetical protein